MTKSSVSGILLLALLWVANVAGAQNEPIVIEAEGGTLGSDFQTTTEEGVTFVTPSTDFASGTNPGNETKIITFSVTFPAAGTYNLFARVRVGAGAANDDSFYYGNGFGTKTITADDEWTRVNNIGSVGYNLADQVVDGGGAAVTQIWKWINLSEFTGDEVATVFSVEAVALTQTFQYGARENGLDLDKLAFGKADLYFTVANLDNGTAGSTTPPEEEEPTEPIALGKTKFLGNVHSNTQLTRFNWYWNQVTPENSGKWGSVEGVRDQMTWGGLDAAYNYARENGFVFKLHVLVWGNQQPAWIETLPAAEQLEEIREWFAAVAERYPDLESIEVVNEPLNDPPTSIGNGNYANALGGTGSTGWDWVLESFRLAREYFPDAQLIINEYNILNSAGNANSYKAMIQSLQEEDLVDAIGVQGHAFTVNNLSAASIKSILDNLATTNLPIYVTELDIDGPTDAIQLQRYQTVFPALWEHPSVQGITLWGFRPGMWRTDQMAYLIGPDGNERPALVWLRDYVESDGSSNNIFVQSISVNTSNGASSILVNGGTLQMTTSVSPSDASDQTVTWSVDDTAIAEIDQAGLLTAKADGTVIVTATANDDLGVIGTKTIVILNQTGVLGMGTSNVLSIYPNPLIAGTNLTLEAQNPVSIIRIFDLSGQLVGHCVGGGLKSKTLKLDLGSGIYLLQIEFEDNTLITSKISVD